MKRKKKLLENESGAALVIALIMMVVLTLIGLASMFSSTFEIKISGGKKCSTDAFYGADSGVQVVTANIQNFNTSLNTYPYDPFADEANPNPNPTNATVSITNDTAQKGAPRGQGISATQFEFEHFQVESTGQTCPNPSPSTTIIQEKVVRLIPTMQGGY
jgi:Tfp pilus assembly protein PilX